MKEKIIAGLKTAYAKLGLSDEAFDGVASLLEKTVKEESEIATAVGGDDVKKLLTTIQGNIDSWKNKFYDTKKSLDEHKKSHPDKDPDGEGAKDDDVVKNLLDKIDDITRRLNDRDAKDHRDATIASVKAAAQQAGCSDERALKLTERMFDIKEGESDEDAAKRFKEEYDANIKEFFGCGAVPYRGVRISTPAAISAADKAAQAREDAKRVREG